MLRIPLTGTWGFVEFINTSVRAQAEQICASIQLNGACYWLLVSAPTVPVPAYACAADAVASMSILPAAQKPKYNHAVDAQVDQSGSTAVQPGATAVATVQSTALHCEGVQTQYPYHGYYPGYGYHPNYGMGIHPAPPLSPPPPPPPLPHPEGCLWTKLTVHALIHFWQDLGSVTWCRYNRFSAAV